MCEQKCRKFTKMLMTCCVVSNQIPIMFALIHAVYGICVGNFDASAIDLPMNVVLPFDTRTIWGWGLLWMLQFNAFNSYPLIMVLTTTYFTCFCFYLIAICDHFNLLIESIRREVDAIQMETNQRGEQWQHVKKTIFRAVDVHVKMFE